jgi:hypothetical protein
VTVDKRISFTPRNLIVEKPVDGIKNWGFGNTLAATRDTFGTDPIVTPTGGR